MLSPMVAIVAVGIVLAVMVWALLSRTGAANPEAQALRNDVSSLRESSERALQGMTTLFAAQMQGMQTSVAAVSSEVSSRLDAINRQMAERLAENSSALAQGSRAVNERIASVQATFATLEKQVGEMTEQSRQLGELSRAITQLQNVFNAPKLRGGFGETQLENLLATVFAREQFAMQYRFPSGDVADAVLHFPQGMVAVDSKFSLENFRRIGAAATEAEAKAARREFLKDVRKRVDEVAGKYIRPADGTVPFALMYVPAENVYYEAIIRDEDGNELYEYCLQKRVVPVSPNSLYAYLQTILVGLNSMRISQRAESVLKEIQSLELELGKFDDVFGKLGTHLKNAARSYDDSSRELTKLESRVQSLGGDSTQQQLLLVELEQRKKAMGPGEQ
jgi:DNA recombination protein RmuC